MGNLKKYFYSEIELSATTKYYLLDIPRIFRNTHSDNVGVTITYRRSIDKTANANRPEWACL